MQIRIPIVTLSDEDLAIIARSHEVPVSEVTPELVQDVIRQGLRDWLDAEGERLHDEDVAAGR